MGKEYNIAVMPGDFIGKEVTPEAQKVVQKAAEMCGFTLRTQHFPHGGEHYKKTNILLPDSVISEFQDFDAIFLGAVGHPEVESSLLEREVLLKIRFDLDQYINLRPSKLYPSVNAPFKLLHPHLPDGYQLITVREGVAGLYRHPGKIETREDGQRVATQIMEYTEADINRTNAYAFALADKMYQEGTPMPVILAGKSNVLKAVFGLWKELFDETRKQYAHIPSGVEGDYLHIDALIGPRLISKGQLPKGEHGFIVVTSNMFGDILTDLTAALAGGMGVGYSGCINPEGTSMFEPIHGSSPKDYGKHVVSPIAAILSGMLMLRELGEKQAADTIDTAVENVLKEGKIPDFTTESGVSTQQQTTYVLEDMDRLAA